MLNIAYTQEMKYQDQLWKSEKEDFEIMERLQNEIVNQAKQNELLKDYYYITYLAYEDEIITEVYESEEIMDNGENSFFTCGNCKALIENIKNLIN